MSSAAVAQAALDMLEACFHAFGDNAERFTCGEMEAIAHAYTVAGQDDSAEQLLTMHSAGDDDPDDLHVPILDERGWIVGHRRKEPA